MPLQGPCGACEGRRPQRGIAGCRAPFLPVPLRRPGGAQRSTPHYAPSFLGERRLVVYVYFDRSLLNSFHKGRWQGGGSQPPCGSNNMGTKRCSVPGGSDSQRLPGCCGALPQRLPLVFGAPQAPCLCHSEVLRQP